MMQETAPALRCSNGPGCVAYPALGEPARLSRGNPGLTCFACEERRVADELETAAANSKTAWSRKANGSRACAEQPCGRSAAERHGAVFFCREHAAVLRALRIWERRKTWALTCERALRSAIASGDEILERKRAKLLLEAEARLAWAEAELDAAEIRARPDRAGWEGQNV